MLQTLFKALRGLQPMDKLLPSLIAKKQKASRALRHLFYLEQRI
jgi:hypothetical protein